MGRSFIDLPVEPLRCVLFCVEVKCEVCGDASLIAARENTNIAKASAPQRQDCGKAAENSGLLSCEVPRPVEDPLIACW